jgi:hypothetical protein
MPEKSSSKRLAIFFLAGILCCHAISAQLSRYVVQLKNKGATVYTLADPSAYLSAQAIQRRNRYHIPIDSSDLPVPVSYVAQIDAVPGVTILNVSRWLNAVAIQTNDANAINTINGFAFVKNVSGVAARPAGKTVNKFPVVSASPVGAGKPEGATTDYFNYGAGSYAEIHLHHGEFLHNIGLRGQGMRIAMLDGGFYSYTTLDAFDSVNTNGQVLGTWDFVDNQASVIEDNAHGMECFSTIAANIPGQFIGKAPKAGFYLFRTEDVFSEFPIEEFNWACGAEKADSIGADVISSSLGYGYEFTDPVADYPYSDLNGNITMSAKAADMAAAKGMLVFNSAGNSGTDYWKMITTPADGDSVVAVGSVNTSGIVAANSSYGPSADGQIKPDVASVGVNALIQLPNNVVGSGSGTSFACPNMAGLATCLWQGFPEVTNMRIVRALREAGSIANTPNDRIGYGIPDMQKAFGSLLAEFSSSTASLSNCTVSLDWTSKDVAGMKYVIERKAAGESNYTPVAEVTAMIGSFLTANTYHLDHALSNVATGAISFRIRQVIDTSAANPVSVFIDTVSVNLQSSCGNPSGPLTGIIVTVAPNPPLGSAHLIIETAYPIDHMPIAVFDMKGRLVLELLKSKPAGRTDIELPVSTLARGKYIIRVNHGTRNLGKTTMLIL